MLLSVSTNIPNNSCLITRCQLPFKKKMKEIIMMIKKINHVYTGKEARNVKRKQHHHFRMVSWMVKKKGKVKKLNRHLFSHNFNVNDLYVCRFIKTNFANRYVAKYVSTYQLTSLFVTSRCVKKERKQHL